MTSLYTEIIKQTTMFSQCKGTCNTDIRSLNSSKTEHISHMLVKCLLNFTDGGLQNLISKHWGDGSKRGFYLLQAIYDWN